MVGLEMPSALPAFEGTPQVTINHEATIDLDSSNAFEGPEKLLEVWFAAAPESLPAGTTKNGLKSVSQEAWKVMLDKVNCKVLSVVESEHVDAYLLSESSMFVFPHKIILKTCGTTTLLWGLRDMLEIAAVDAKFPSVEGTQGRAAATPYRVFYSRKNFLFPDKQHGPHKSWQSEVEFLDNMFTGGSAYLVGKMNKDHWYLYLTTPNMTALASPQTFDNERVGTKTKFIDAPVGFASPDAAIAEYNTDDETLEVLMTDLDVENAKQFYLKDASAVASARYTLKAQQASKDVGAQLGDLNTLTDLSMSGTTVGSVSVRDDTFDGLSNGSAETTQTPDDTGFPEELTCEGHALGTVVSEACGLSDVYPTSRFPDARVDAYLFTPCGFSANGVIPAPDQAGTATHYFTVHVTPEPQCSYASFETNVPERQTGRETVDVIEHVVGIFKPGRFSVTLFEAKAKVAEKNSDVIARTNGMETILGYRRVERIVHDLDGYDLVFRQYEREGWTPGGLRVGEPRGEQASEG